jgi:hypothetical protein
MTCMKLKLSFDQGSPHGHLIQPQADVPEALLEVAMDSLFKLSWLLEFVAKFGVLGTCGVDALANPSGWSAKTGARTISENFTTMNSSAISSTCHLHFFCSVSLRISRQAC